VCYWKLCRVTLMSLIEEAWEGDPLRRGAENALLVRGNAGSTRVQGRNIERHAVTLISFEEERFDVMWNRNTKAMLADPRPRFMDSSCLVPKALISRAD
jgi:hypothetical protein